MKNKHACIIAAALLISLIAASFANYIYVKNTFNIISTELEALTGDLTTNVDALERIIGIWNERRAILDFTLSDPELEKMSELFEEAVIAAKNGDNVSYETAMARLKRAVADIKDLERIAVDIIF